MAKFKVKDHVLLRLLGRGARSYIYEAKNMKTAETVAVKIVPRKSSADDKFVAQIVNEYEIGSRLNHPNIVKYYALEKVRKFFTPSQYNLIMEYVKGTTLEKFRDVPVPELLELFIQLGETLSFMHEQGFIHSDLTPHNLIITPERKIKLFDLGLACRKGTRRERIQGTVDFIAPEQARKGFIDSATDIYCFGSSLYYLLTGRNVPSSLVLFKKSRGSSLRKYIESVKDLNPEVPPVLDDIIMQCIERKKENRPHSIKDVTDRLRNILEKMAPNKV